MGTTFSIHIYSPDQQTASAQLDVAFEEIERIEEALSNYRPSSELSRINRLAGLHAVTTDPEVFGLLQTAVDYSRRSQGAFDVTVGPLMRAWGFFRANGHFPNQKELNSARASTGWQYVELDQRFRTVRFRRHNMELDLGGIGKGYAVDRVVALLREAGVQAALVDAGSSTVYALGSPPGTNGWKVLVPEPGKRSIAISEVMLRDRSLSTSGSYEKFFRLNGRTYCHIMDPRTGYPVDRMLQTTVIAPTGTETDALSTSIFVLGPDAGREMLKSIPGASAIWITGTTAERSHIAQWHWPATLCQGGGCSTKKRR
jgi:thiamine biosynthesis lipoprotein